jgi:hypothetical protein
MVTVRVPPLRAGDKLMRDEFMRRWEAEPGSEPKVRSVKKAGVPE